MNRHSISALFLLIASIANGQSSLLWRIEGNNLKKPSYLFGTIHIIPQKDYFEPKGMVESLEKSELYVGELNLTDSSAIGIEMMSNMAMKNDTTLDMLLSPQDYKKLDSFFVSKMGMGIEMFKALKPILLSTMLLPMTSGEEVTSYEMELLKKANLKGIPMAGLESVSEQMSFIDQLPYSYQAKELMKVLEGDVKDDDLTVLIEAYKSQNIDQLADEIKKQTQSSIAMESILLNDRNKNWIPKIEDLIKKQSCFIAVGAGHLGGKEGVINLLKQKGYRLTPMR
ncbi:MAG TPA: TraB/GumN family protein [Saprospiraceae bacterium]|nr:TraB/GumN family protein [Saprospiraceae bacterium]